MATSSTFRTFANAILWIPVPIFFMDHVISIASVEGRSMQPTFNPDSNLLQRDWVLLERWKINSRELNRGDIVTLSSPIDSQRKIIKRIIAIEGDTIRTLPPYKDKWVIIPKGHVWVEGDEGFHTRDSNVYGPVPLGLITSKVGYIIFPLRRFGKVESKNISPGRLIKRR